MCDDLTVIDSDAFLAELPRQPGVTRRQLGALSAGAALMATLPGVVQAQVTKDREVNIKTPDGYADGYFVSPNAGTHPGVLIWPDVLGLRPAFRQMANRLAQSGYAVLVINPYYRQARAPVVAPGDSFQHPAVRNKVLPFARQLSSQTVDTDASAFVAFLDAQPEVDTNRGVGTMGYCMGGPFTVRTAAKLPERIAAGASFHGGRLVTDSTDSPHLLVPQIRADFLFAIAENDDEKEPEVKAILAKTFAAANLNAEIEVYAGALHGWCPPDSLVYNEAMAERAWQRLLNLFAGALST